MLCIENDDGGVSQTTDVKAFVDARIDIRKLAQFLSCQQFSPSKVICSERSLLIFAVKLAVVTFRSVTSSVVLTTRMSPLHDSTDVFYILWRSLYENSCHMLHMVSTDWESQVISLVTESRVILLMVEKNHVYHPSYVTVIYFCFTK